MPCQRAREQAEHRAFLEANRRDVDRFAGVTDPLELLRIHYTPVPRDPLVCQAPCPRPAWELHAALTPAQARSLGAEALGFLEEDPWRAERIAGDLAAWCPGVDLSPLQEGFLEAGHLDPEHLFRGAGPEVRDRLLALGDSPEARNLALACLAWVGDEEVVRRFAAWRRDPPPWAGELYRPPEDHAHLAGWEPTEDGTRRELTRTPCWPLVPRSTSAPVGPAVRSLVPREDACPWCQGLLVDLLRVDLLRVDLLRADELARELTGWPPGGQVVAIPTCLVCGSFGTVYSEPDADGGARWSRATPRPEYLPDASDELGDGELPRDSLELDPTPRAPWFAVDWARGQPGSQIGGHPSWIQGPEYPTCPGCERSMPFLGQVEVEDLDPSGEGIYYAFLCRDCGTGATSYQQT